MNKNKKVARENELAKDGLSAEDIKQEFRGRNRRRGKAPSSERQFVVTKSTNNDESWYSNITKTLDAVAKLPMSNVAGLPDIISSSSGSSTTYSDTTYVLKSARAITPSGICVIPLVLTAGVASDVTAAINVGAQQIYALDRAANSGAKNYDSVDVMMYVMAMDSAYCLYEHLTRAYRLLLSYNYANRWMPEYLLRALGFSNPSNLESSMADFRALLNTFAYKLGSIPVPNVFDIIKRHSWLFTNVYKDAEQRKAQLYVFKPSHLYLYDETKDPAQLTCTPIETFPDLKSISDTIDKFMNPLLGSQDIGIIAGDLIKAFGEGNSIHVNLVNDMDIIEPVYSAEVLSQIENLESISSIIPTSNDIVPQYSDIGKGPWLKCEPKVTFAINQDNPNNRQAAFRSLRKSILNMHMDDPSAGNIMVATRLKFNVNPKSEEIGSELGYAITSCGSEIAMAPSYYNILFSVDGAVIQPGSLYSSRINQEIAIIPNVTSTAEAMNIAEALSWLSNFDWHPIVYLWQWNREGDNTFQLKSPIVDYDNYTYLEDSTIKSMNDVAIMSEFAVHGFRATTL